MPALVMLMLAIQIAILGVTIWSIAIRPASNERPQPVWSSLAISLFVIGNVSIQIARDHSVSPGSDELFFGGAVMIGMAIVCALLLWRERRSRLSITKSRVG